jgi:hypothetical protein
MKTVTGMMELRCISRHCEPPGRREAPPDDRLSEAIQKCFKGNSLDCFVALPAMTRPFDNNDDSLLPFINASLIIEA